MRIAFAMTIPVDTILGLRPPPLYPCVDSPPSRCPAVADTNTAMMMILCFFIVQPNATTTNGDPSEPLMDMNVIVEGGAEMGTP